MSRNILQDIIEDFNPVKFIQFFRQKNRNFAPRSEQLSIYDDADFSEGHKLGEIHFDSGEKMIFCTFESNKSLSERSGKKLQYEKAKKILKEKQADAGIFIFYDDNGSFRFSLAYANYLGKKRDWSSFRRFTYFVDNELTNKTFLLRIGDGDFSSFSKIKDAFSVEKVTKEFYESIANWYFWAVEHCCFPKGAETEENGRNIAIIRLITRMIFVWFMRERGLMPKHLFEKESIDNILVNLSAEDSTYYTAILQNLFFATLSTKKEERKFRSEVRGHKGYNPDFGNQYVCRYHQFFKKPDEIESYFGEIPFLNGGLFECLDDGRNNYYVDGFTARKQFQPIVPNFLFFSQERKADLNKAYGTKKKIYKVRGLLDILASFNFTIDENSPDDADVALDPELLGRVFENLLASFNPETATTARKATGSYYTPREIVDYMVTESLKAYFKTHLESTKDIDEKLEELFSNENLDNPFDQTQSIKLVELIESVTIVDPAVGSGAFPMGALNRLVFILNKIDPGNELWEQAQIKAADAIPDPSAKRMAKEKIEEFFQGKNADYGRKLFLIQRCIYGVDIQLIAVEIAKLRFFISLLVDEKIDKEKDNWGIEPLPNLDFKIMHGNSLIELLSSSLLAKNADSERSQLIDELKTRKDEFLSLSDPTGKKKCKERILELVRSIVNYDQDKKKEQLERDLSFFNDRQKLFEMSGDNLNLDDAVQKKQAKISAELRQLEKIQSISPKDHFEWHLHFNEVFERGGFDIVIGNPPYVQIKQIPWNDRKVFKKKYISAVGRFNLFYFFLELTNKLARNKGISAYIVPDRLLLNTQCDKLRQWLLKNQTIIEIDSFAEGVFEAVVDSIIITYENTENYKKNILVKNRVSLANLKNTTKTIIPINYFIDSPNTQFDLSYSAVNAKLLSKIKTYTIPLTGISDIKDGIIQGKVADKLFLKNVLDEKSKSLLFGEDIVKFSINFNNNWVNYKPSEMMAFEVRRRGKGIRHGLWMRNPEIFERNKILTRQTADEIIAAYDTENYYYSNTLHGTTITDNKYDPLYILALLNSKLMTWYYRRTTAEEGKVFAQIKIELLKLLPIKIADKKPQQPFISLVDQILTITKSGDYLQNPNKQAEVKKYEKQIDQLVYKLYDLTPEEIQIIENNS